MREKICHCPWKIPREFLCGGKRNNSIILCMPYVDSVSDFLQIFVISRCAEVSLRDTSSMKMDLTNFKVFSCHTDDRKYLLLLIWADSSFLRMTDTNIRKILQ